MNIIGYPRQSGPVCLFLVRITPQVTCKMADENLQAVSSMVERLVSPSRSGSKPLAPMSAGGCAHLIRFSLNIFPGKYLIRCESPSPGGGLMDFSPNQL